MHFSDRTLAQRLWSRVDRSGGADACWLWTGSVRGDGYGQIFLDGHNLLTSRAAWIVTNGPIPDGMLVCHHCDNPPCCNPAHLFLGTHADNTADMVAKGRWKKPPTMRGSAHPAARLRDEQVRQIRELLADRTPQSRIAAQFNVSQSTISLIATGKHWINV